MIGFWVSGGFRNASWSDFKLVFIFGIIGLIIAILLSPKINILNLGDDVAIGLGENPEKIRFFSLIVMIPMCAAAVAVGKNIAFVGLIVPQIVRKLLGEDYRKNIPCSFLLGAVLLTYADIAARMLFDPYETPIGVFTSLIGIPFFIAIARKERIMKKNKFKIVFTILFALLLISFFVTLCWGTYKVSVGEVINTLLGKGTKLQNAAILNLRLPRMLVGIFVAIALSTAGSVLQTITKNDLADTGIIGINAGAAVAAVLFITYQTANYYSELGELSIYVLPFMAVVGAAVSAFAMYMLSSRNGIRPKDFINWYRH